MCWRMQRPKLQGQMEEQKLQKKINKKGRRIQQIKREEEFNKIELICKVNL